jgi:uracil-DNA glycosylase family 4
MNEQTSSYYLNTMDITCWSLRTGASSAMPVADLSVNICEKTPDSWASLRAEVAACQLCALAQGRTQTVFGTGAVNAELLIVGEAPGLHEDQQGQPFVGRAGQLLNAMLKSIGLNREKVYIANVLKCRPPDNRDPLPEEVRQCTTYLERQVALLQPKVILAVGRYAAHYLLNCTTSLNKLRGQKHQFRDTNIPLIVSYHPAYLLRNPVDKGNAYVDLLMLRKLLM